MKMKIQPRESGPSHSPAARRARGQGNGGPDASALWQENLTLRSDMTDLRADLGALQRRQDRLERENTSLREEVRQAAELIGRLPSYIQATTVALQAAARVLATVAKHLEDSGDRETQQSQELRDVLARYLADQEALSGALHQGHEQVIKGLAQLQKRQDKVRQQIAEVAESVSQHLEGLQNRTHEHLNRLAGRLAQVADLEASGLAHLDQAFQKVLEQQEQFTQALRSAHNTTTDLVRTSEQILAEHHRLHTADVLAEVRRLNDFALKCLADGRPESAISSLERACALAPDAPAPLYNLAVAHLFQGRLDTGAAIADRMAGQSTDRTPFGLLSGLIALARRDPEAASHSLAPLAQSARSHGSLQAAAGVAWSLTGQPAEALDAFRHAGRTSDELAQMLEAAGLAEPDARR